MRSAGCCLFLILFCLAGMPLRAAEAAKPNESLPERHLKQIVERQRSLLEQANEQGEKLDSEGLRSQLQSIVHEYEMLLHEDPNFAPAYYAEGILLRKVGMNKEAVGLMLKANQIDPNIPMVKNQIGNYLAEDGKPLEAVSYYLAAIKLEPKEPLYHFQLGTLLHEAREDFLKSGDWTRDSIGNAEHEAFRRAAELDPAKLEYAYSYGESFYDLSKPDWDQALKFWGQLEDKARTAKEREAMRLQAANILLLQDKPDYASTLLNTVTDPDLQAQKQKLVAQIGEKAKK